MVEALQQLLAAREAQQQLLAARDGRAGADVCLHAADAATHLGAAPPVSTGTSTTNLAASSGAASPISTGASTTNLAANCVCRLYRLNLHITNGLIPYAECSITQQHRHEHKPVGGCSPRAVTGHVGPWHAEASKSAHPATA
eukprot:scaffold39434_cov19-Tisochrysis_lutea.AAC.1